MSSRLSKKPQARVRRRRTPRLKERRRRLIDSLPANNNLRVASRSGRRTLMILALPSSVTANSTDLNQTQKSDMPRSTQRCMSSKSLTLAKRYSFVADFTVLELLERSLCSS